MRIGVDILALQSPNSRRRGIGRFAHGLLRGLLSVGRDAEFILYAHAGLPSDDLPSSPNALLRPMPHAATPASAVDAAVRSNPDEVDAFLLFSPFEVGLGYAPPPRPLLGPALISVVHDFIPFLFQERYLTWPPSADEFYRHLGRLGSYDALLANSDATRRDALRLTGLPADRVVTILGAGDGDFFGPACGDPSDSVDQSELLALGIDRPFVLAVASFDWRKNLRGLLDAFALLPRGLRDRHQLVIACFFRPEEAEHVRQLARDRGLADSLVLTGEVSDEALRALYRRCAAFASPAHYEGLGLPLLEAMLCGAPALAGNNSSQAEVVADAGLLANSHDPADIAEKLGQLLTDQPLVARLRVAGRAHAESFTWEHSATRALAAIEDAAERARRGRPAIKRPSPPEPRPFETSPPTAVQNGQPGVVRSKPDGKGRRIGVDMLPIQSPGSRTRGIGRFAANLVASMVEADREDRYVLYVHPGLPEPAIPQSDRVTVRKLSYGRDQAVTTVRSALEGLVRSNPDRLDTLLLPSPFELLDDYAPPSRPLGGPTLAVVVHDLIPFLFQERYLSDPAVSGWFYRRLRTIQQYDLILTNSDATRADCLRLMGMPPGRVVTIGGSGNGHFFRPEASAEEAAETDRLLDELGIEGPFVLAVASGDERKNVGGLIDAFALLPDEAKRSHRLVIACGLDDNSRRQIDRRGAERGISTSIHLTGEVSDEALRALYRRCAAFASPAHYEGLGLPLLEAMLCGAPVLAGNNSSQAEVVADAGLLANSHDPADIAEKLAGLLADPSLSARLREAGLERAAGFTWEKAATRAIDAISRLDRPGRRLRVDRSPAPRARVAMFSPYPPKRSGIATYSARLAVHLARHAAVDVYHDSGYVPDLGPGTRGTARYDHRLFARNEDILGHQAVVYQFGNSLYHEFMVDCLKTRPGIVVLHDFCLAGLFAGMAARSRRPGILRDEIAHCHPDIAREVLPKLDEWALEPGFVQGACARRGIWVNRRVLELAESVIVHSPWCVEQAKAVDPSLARKMTVIPLGASAVPTTPERRERARRQFGLPDEALVIGSLGILHSTKRNVPTIEAFARVADRVPGAILVFVGEDLGFGEAAERATALGLGDRVRFFGRYPGDLADVAAMLDIGVNLREPPTNGETSAALLDLLRTGVATVVSEVGTFAHFPDHVVRKIRDFEGGPDAIADALMALAVDRDARETLGTAALDYVVREHSWERVASLYSEVITPRARPSVPRPHLGRRRDGSAQGAQSQVIGG